MRTPATKRNLLKKKIPRFPQEARKTPEYCPRQSPLFEEKSTIRWNRKKPKADPHEENRSLGRSGSKETRRKELAALKNRPALKKQSGVKRGGERTLAATSGVYAKKSPVISSMKRDGRKNRLEVGRSSRSSRGNDTRGTTSDDRNLAATPSLTKPTRAPEKGVNAKNQGGKRNPRGTSLFRSEGKISAKGGKNVLYEQQRLQKGKVETVQTEITSKPLKKGAEKKNHIIRRGTSGVSPGGKEEEQLGQKLNLRSEQKAAFPSNRRNQEKKRRKKKKKSCIKRNQGSKALRRATCPERSADRPRENVKRRSRQGTGLTSGDFLLTTRRRSEGEPGRCESI